MADRKLFIGVLTLVLALTAGLGSAFAQSSMVGLETAINGSTKVPDNFSIGLQGLSMPGAFKLSLVGWSLDYMERKLPVNLLADSEEKSRKLRGVLYSAFLGMGVTNFLGVYAGGGLGVSWVPALTTGYNTGLAWKVDFGAILGSSGSWYVKGGFTSSGIRGPALALGLGFGLSDYY